MTHRARNSGISLTSDDAALIKGMIARGDRQHDIAAWFGVNPGRISEVATGVKFGSIRSASQSALPPQGPYVGAGAPRDDQQYKLQFGSR